jgi:hypothetical protein
MTGSRSFSWSQCRGLLGKIKPLLAATIGTTAMALSAATASADIACSGNVCWHVKERYTFPKESRVIVHEDTWKPAPSITIREHEGRGYWKGESWVDF